MRILIIGPVGSGKTTQAVMLAEKLKLGVLRVGDLVRERADEDSEVGRICNGALHSGQLVPDQIIGEMVTKEIENRDLGGFVTDSYPRRVSQLEVFDPKLDLVFYLKLEDEVVAGRLSTRGREDDSPKIVEERLKVYHSETEPLLGYYGDQNKLITIDGDQSVEVIHQVIMKEIEQYER